MTPTTNNFYQTDCYSHFPGENPEAHRKIWGPTYILRIDHPSKQAVAHYIRLHNALQACSPVQDLYNISVETASELLLNSYLDFQLSND